MKLAQLLKKHNFSEEATRIFLDSGIKELYPPQAEAINGGILNRKNVLMSVPTAAGKTLVAELCMIKNILDNNGRCLYIAPLKALASEKYKDFQKKYTSLGITVGLAIGDADSPTAKLNEYKIIVATAEKVDSLLRSKAKWLADGLSAVVLDEIHFINDNERGPTMEILIARIRQLNPEIQILGLSATVSNASEMAGWLDAHLVQSNWRPIPLKEGVYFGEQIVFSEAGVRQIIEDVPDDVSKLTLDTLRSKGQVLIFVNSRRSAVAVSRQVCRAVGQVISQEEKKELLALSKKIVGSPSEATKLCHKLGDIVANGAAFHHAGLKPKQRELIEENFKKNLIKVIGCTPTLAAGVNLPARRAIIRDSKRFEMGVGAAYIPTSEYKQCAGRAGRPQYDDFGEAVLIAKTHSETSTLFERYILASPEPITSKLANEAALRIHILSSIAGGYVHDINSMFDFMSHTFLHFQKLEPNLLDLISEIFDFLQQQEFIQKSGYRYFATALGNLTSRLYIDPLTSITLRDGLSLFNAQHPFSAIGALHLMTCCPDGPSMNVGKNDPESIEQFANTFRDDFICTPENTGKLEDFYSHMSTLKTTWLLNQWVEEEKEEVICDQFNVGPGDVYRFVESTRWLLYAATTIAELMRKKKLTFQIEDLRKRIQYGIREELLELASLKGVGRVRARTLYDRGLQSLSSLKLKSSDELSAIPTIGKALAKDIVSQLSKKPYQKRSTNYKVPAGSAANADEWED